MRAALVLLALAGGTAAAAAQAPTQSTSPQPSFKIGFVNAREILQRTPGYAAAESTWTRELKGFQDEIRKLQQQLDSAAQAFDQQSIALSTTAKQSKQRELQGLQQRLEQRSNELQERAASRERELLEPIQARVNSIIQGIRAEGNYALIFNADAPGNFIVAADPALNLTARVLQRLQQSQ